MWTAASLIPMEYQNGDTVSFCLTPVCTLKKPVRLAAPHDESMLPSMQDDSFDKRCMAITSPLDSDTAATTTVCALCHLVCSVLLAYSISIVLVNVDTSCPGVTIVFLICITNPVSAFVFHANYDRSLFRRARLRDIVIIRIIAAVA